MAKLKIWNGRSHGHTFKNHHVYVAATSMKQAAELISEACYGGVKKIISTSEISNYYSKGCWGNSMDGIEPTEPCVYLSDNDKPNSKPFRVI